MAEVWGWIKIGLLLGGIVLMMVGTLWVRGANLARFFGYEWNSDRGVWVILTGVAMTAIGFALVTYRL